MDRMAAKLTKQRRAEIERDAQEVVDLVYEAKSKHEDHCTLWKMDKMDDCPVCVSMEAAWSDAEDFAKDPFAAVSS